MPDIFTIYEGEVAPVDGSEGQGKRLLDVVGDDVFYLNSPHFNISDTKLQPGESVVFSERVWITTAGQSTKVIVTP